MFAVTNIILSCVFVVLWSSGWVGAKFGIGLIGPFSFLAWRYSLVVLLLALFVIFFKKWRRLTRKEWIPHLQVGFLAHGVFLSASFGSIEFGVSAGMVAFVTAMQPIFTAVISQRFVGEAPALRQWIGNVLGLSAVGLVVANQISADGGIIAYALLIGSVLAISIATLIDRSNNLRNRRRGRKSIPLSQVMLIHSVSALSLFALLGYSLEGFQTAWNSALIITILYMSIVVSIGSYGCMFLLLRRISITRVSALAYLTPPVTIFMAWLLFNEVLSSIEWIGLALAGVAVAIVYRCGDVSSKGDNVTRRRKKRPEFQIGKGVVR